MTGNMHDAGYRLYDEVPRGSLRKHGLMHDRRDGVTIDGLLAGLVCADNPSYGSHDGRAVRDDRSRSRVRKRAEALLVAGAPCSGKTAFATDLLLGALCVFGDDGAVMAVSGRQSADRIGNEVIRRVGFTSQARPVTTLSAIAFRLITDVRTRRGLPAPKLLNGAEQDALLRRVTAAHVRHAQSGDPCQTCGLLREYFAAEDWAGVIAADGADRGAASPTTPHESRTAGNPDHTPADASDAGETSGDAKRGNSSAMFSRGINDAFVMQLRDMIARMNELGVMPGDEPRLLAKLSAWTPHTERLHVQWRLAFALRREYAQAISDAYPHEYRLDSSQLLVGGEQAAHEAEPGRLPQLVVVDDVQDLTLAGFSFLAALQERGVRLVLVGNPDESVQSFRGSYPEYLFAQARNRLGARLLRIESSHAAEHGGAMTVTDEGALAGIHGGDGSAGTAPPEPERHCYRDVVAARISLSIRSLQDDDTALPDRPGKIRPLSGSLPIAPLGADDPRMCDGSVHTGLYRSPSEELDDVVWRIKRAHLMDGRAWNDLAVIAHDNATVRQFGERLRRDGVPVRYSSVTRPLRDEPFVQGLFALLELARLRNQAHERGLTSLPMSLGGMSAFVRSRVSAVMGCPLISVGSGSDHEGRPARIASVEAAMNALGALSGVMGERDDEPSAALLHLTQAWDRLRGPVIAARDAAAVVTDDSLVAPDARGGDDVRFGIDALYLMLEFDDADAVLAAIQAVCGPDPHAQAFAHLWDLVRSIARGLPELPSREPQYALWLAWDSCKVASRWQREALNNTESGQAANDRLDTAMRLFDYASGSASADDLPGFFEQIRSMRIEADSLAKVAPIDQAVTLTTPAGAAGRHWPLVWLPVLQQGVWPNLAARNTMFGGEDLADVMLYGVLAEDMGVDGDPRLESVLSAEQKSLLVAFTRAEERITVSAVYNDDLTPSDFLYGYLPEWFDRAAHADPARRDYAEVGQSDRFCGLDGTPRGLVAAARVTLAREPAGSPASRDAADALRLLAGHGIETADPRNWPFANPVGDGSVDAGAETGTADGNGERAIPVSEAAERSAAADQLVSRSMERPITLSPSAVDRIWACPVCWLMENQFSGPSAGSVAMTFGTLIHTVAQRASEEGLDLPGGEGTESERAEAIRSRMMEIYRDLRADPSGIADPADRYAVARQDATAEDVLGNIAMYFVRSNDGDYPTGNVNNFTIGTLDSAECERSFSALFTVDDILEAYNAVDGVEPIDRSELVSIMGTLVGGWPDAMHERLAVRLTGRMDRVEHRTMADGGERIRLIDYKTGQVPSVKAVFNDLQLVCYQLGLAFPEGGERGATALSIMPRIAQSALFHVGHNAAPAQSRGAESLYQPPLFAGGSLNDGAFAARYYYKDPAKLTDIPELDERPPRGVRESVWRRFLELRGTQAVWALTMISRVFYAAAASRSRRLIAHPQPSHVEACRLKESCPACAGQVDTVFETRQA